MGLRIDTLLHWLCLLKSRSLAARGCREGRILLNGRPVKPSAEVRAGDWVSLAADREEGWRTVEIVQLPERQASRAQAREFFRPLAGQTGPDTSEGT